MSATRPSAAADAPAGPEIDPPSVAGAGIDFNAARSSLQNACGDCHGGAEPDGGFSLRSIEHEDSLGSAPDDWMRARRRVLDGSMPPEDAETLPLDERLSLVRWIDGAVHRALLASGESAGPPIVRRMTAHEYSNTIRDLLSVHYDAGHALPQDIAGGEGFNNATETLIVAPIHAEKFLDAATAALDYAGRDSAARGLLMPHQPSSDADETAAASANLAKLVERAFRRPVSASELAPFERLFADARADGLAFDLAMFYAFRGVLTSPGFLFLSESAPQTPEAEEPLSDWELASRLSYFLWATMPDQALRDAAGRGELKSAAAVRDQASRMLTVEGRLNDSLKHFVGQWLGTADLGGAKQVDPKRHPWVQDHHVAALREQPVYVVESVIRENRSLLELIDSDWTFLNVELLGLYQIDESEVEAKEAKRVAQHLVRVGLPDKHRYRSGLLGAGGVMVITSYPHRSSPVLRGGWTLDKLLGVELPPPPPNTPKLDDTHGAGADETLRERLVRHRADPACAGCHSRIDPVGFALENFDELGRWRASDESGPIDAAATMPGGTTIDGVAGLKQFLVENKDDFVRCVTEKMLAYALARGLKVSDYATIETITTRLKDNDYRAQELVLGIVESKPFRFKGEPQ
ncbi:MAG: DUF1592 domain-containing protein [Lacipirellulaceae bacterium]